MSDELRIWNRFCQTPEAATKSFNKGGWQGTDINPAYRLRCLTELFGPVGEGWGWTIHERWRESWPTRVKNKDGGWVEYVAECAFVSLSLWYVQDGKRHECPAQIGGTECDLSPDEVWKMSITDAIGKCCLALGIAADVYMGQFDGKHRGESPPREQKPACPQCNSVTHVIKGKEEYGGGWLCWKSKGGCGHKWQDAPSSDPSNIPGVTTGDKVKNPSAFNHTNFVAALEKATDTAAIRKIVESLDKKPMPLPDKIVPYREAFLRLFQLDNADLGWAETKIAALRQATCLDEPTYTELKAKLDSRMQPA